MRLPDLLLSALGSAVMDSINSLKIIYDPDELVFYLQLYNVPFCDIIQVHHFFMAVKQMYQRKKIPVKPGLFLLLF